MARPSLPLEPAWDIIEHVCQLVTFFEQPIDPTSEWCVDGFVTLRLVNKAFDQEVLVALGTCTGSFGFRRKYHFQGLKQCALFARCAAKVLIRQSIIQTSARPDRILLHQIVEKLQVGPENDGKLRAMEILFNQASDCIRYHGHDHNRGTFRGFPFLTDIFGFRWTTTEEQEKLRTHLAPAAILLKLPCFYEQILISHRPGDELSMDCEYFGTLLYAAIKSHQNGLATNIINLMKRHNVEEVRNCYQAAVISNDFKMLQHLIMHAHQIVPDHRKSMREAVMEASQLGNTKMGDLLFTHIKQTYPDLINADLLSESTHYAVTSGHIEYLKFLVLQGANMMAKPHWDVSRATPLMVAAWTGNTIILHWLIKSRNGIPIHDDPSVVAAIDGDQVESMRMLSHHGGLDGIEPGKWQGEHFLRVHLRKSSRVFKSVLLELHAVCLDDPELKELMARACLDGNLGMCDVLIEAGIAPDMPLGQKIAWSNRVVPSWTTANFALASSHPGAKKIAAKILATNTTRPQNGELHDGVIFNEGMFPYRDSFRRYRSGMPDSLKYAY